tara:strand:+ start:227 stop:1156 length:930 start_codon:yes stop_codon:yes gene_type:complete
MIEKVFLKKGIIVESNPNKWWWKTHAAAPTPLKINDDIYRIFFSGRDIKNRSQIGFIDIEIINDDIKVINYSEDPVLTNGKLGLFDDNGVTPSSVIKVKDKIYLYYIGWNPGSTTRMNIFGGLAISSDNGINFERYSKAPILERSKLNPYINTSAFVVQINKDLFYMYYVSGTEWVNKDLPKYNIQFAKSIDGKEWIREGKVCIDYKNSDEVALARPFVLKNKDFFEMWFCHKSINTNYAFGYATSNDGINWIRKENLPAEIPLSNQNSWDSEMNAYPSIIRNKEFEFLIYNGNGYGLSGMGYAVRKIL